MDSQNSPCPEPRIRNVRSCETDKFLSVNDPTSSTSATCDPAEVVDSWVPLVPKLEPDSDDVHRNSSERPQTIERTTVLVQPDVGESSAPNVDADTEWNVHLSSVSVIINEEDYPKIKSENVESGKCGVSCDADRSESHLSNAKRASTNQKRARDIQRTKEGGNSDDSEAVDAPKLAVDSRDKVSKRRKIDSAETLAASHGSGNGELHESNSSTTATKDVNPCIGGFEYRSPTDHSLRYECSVCHRVFKKHCHLVDHSLTHTGEKPYECTFCSMAFASSANLKRHTRTHTGEKPYSCHLCQRKFTDWSGYTIHTRSHTGERPYRCQVCDKTFKANGGLKKHGRVHTGEKPYKCQVCSAEFKQQSHLKVHTKIHPTTSQA